MISLPVVRPIPLSRGMFAWVDQDDYEAVSAIKWYAQKTRRPGVFYAANKNGSVVILMHRLIVKPKDGVVDHRNGNGINNCRYNLRKCTHSQNSMNMKVRAASSRFKGVAWHKASGKWKAQISPNGKTIYLGLFTKEDAAALAYDSAAVEYFGDFCQTNFPRETYGLAQLSRHAGDEEGVGRVDRVQEEATPLQVQDRQGSYKPVSLPG